MRTGKVPDGGLVGIRADGTFGRLTTGGFGGATVILGGGGTRSAALMALVIDTKAKKKPPPLEQLNMRFAALRS